MSYIHGNTRDEQDRLLVLNQLLNERCLAKIHLNNSARVLDIGSGLGVFSRMIACKLEAGSVVGVEKSTSQLERCLELAAEDGDQDLVDFREGSAYNLPLNDSEWGTFDVVFIRFLLEHLNDPLRAVAQAYKALKPEGRIFLIDDDHANFRITPECKGFDVLWPLYWKAYEKLGNDPFVGRQLITFLHKTGFTNNNIDFVLFGGTQDNPTFAYYANNLIHILEEARELMFQISYFDSDQFDAYIDEIREWSRLPDATLWYVANFAQGTKKA